MEVGCFDTRFYGFKKIKSKKDIDNFEIIGRGGTDFDNTIVHFSKDLSVNKIVFTDGYCDMSRTDRYLSNVIWIVYDNPEFVSTCGKVIHLSREEYQRLSSTIKQDELTM